MELEKSPTPNQPASLHLLGLPSLHCLITTVSVNEIGLTIQDQPGDQKSEKGDLAEIHVNTGQLSTLKVRATIEKVTDNHLLLSYLNPRDATIRQLVNWLGQSSMAASHTLINEQSLIQELCAICLKQFASLIEIYLEQTDSRLLSLAEVATNNDHQNKVFEVKSLLRQHGNTIKQLYCHYLQAGFQHQHSSRTASKQTTAEASYEHMTLVDRKEFEDWLSLEKIIRRGNERYYTSLTCLNKRYSQLIHREIDAKELPVSLHNICQALQGAIKNYPIAPELLPILYRFFDEAVVSQLDNVFDTLNSKLKAYGILPNIESQILRERRPTNSATFKTGKTPTSTTDNKEDPYSNVVPLHNNPGLYSTVNDMLGLLRSNSPDSDSVTSGESTDPQQLIDTLSSIQHNQQAVEAIAQGQSLQSWLQNNTTIHLSNELQDLLKLVTNIFQNINDYSQISSTLLSQIKHLEIPIAKMALLDANFFASPEHPAKLLLNQLIELGLNSDMPNQALEKKFDAVISGITDNFQQDSRVFQQALADATSIARHQCNAYNRNIQRIAQTYEGRQRVQQAEDAIEREIQRRVSPPQAPDIIIDLIDNGWRELLKLTYIKLGQDSDALQQQLTTLDQLSLWLSENSSANNSENGSDPQSTIKQELDADVFTDLIAQQLHIVFPGDYRYQSTVEKVRTTLKGQREVVMIPLENNSALKVHSPNELQKELEAANPQLNRWFKRARSLQVGDEFSYLGDDSGKRNIKLAWTSDNQQHFVFVNNRGQKILDVDLVDLATELSQGMSPVEKQSDWPLVERSLYSTVQQAYEQLAFKSSHDELTGLINRKECERLLSSAMLDAKNNQQQHCLLYMDIDNFALANSLHGHVAGDQLLVDISHLIKDKSPENSIIARMAGNEFVILLQRKDMLDSQHIASELCTELENQKFYWQGHTVDFTCSIGLMAINKYTESVVDLLRNTISACQTAKGNGGNRVNDFKQDAELHTRREKLLSWIDELNTVLSSDRLVLRGQKISPLNAEDNDLHYEILLAIKGDKGELHSPVDFIEAAECYNRMQRIDRWVIENTFQWLNTVSASGITAPAVSINLSGNSLNDDQFMDFILEQLARYKVPTNKICFEVTETATINNLAEAADFIREIKKIGCKFSLDDFGSGNASYQYLKHLPVDYLKIDGMFVKDMDKNKNDYALVQSINEIAHLMGKKTIAEYAESEQIIRLLNDIGVDYVQGYAISRPTELSKLDLQQ